MVVGLWGKTVISILGWGQVCLVAMRADGKITSLTIGHGAKIPSGDDDGIGVGSGKWGWNQYNIARPVVASGQVPKAFLGADRDDAFGFRVEFDVKSSAIPIVIRGGAC